MRLFVPTNPKVIVFMPRGGGMTVDGYDYFNYTSDNALALMHYMVERYGNSFIYKLACDASQYEELHQKLRNIKEVDIDCFPCFSYEKPFSFKKLLPLLQGKYIFMSEIIPIYTKKRNQKVVFLNYFVPFKDDYGYRFLPLQKFESLIDYSITTSLLSSYIISTVYKISLSKCISLGFSRNDCLLTFNGNNALDDFLEQSVDYKVKHVLLYTPTHRDYERGKTDERELLGFDIDYKKLDVVLRENSAIIICKIHSAQNKKVIDFKLPKGIVLYSSNTDFTLCELMQRADCMITDYTSTYFDYLLLDRPVLFNFYDYDVYKKSRGFSYDPLEPFMAGDVFNDEESFFKSIIDFFNGVDIHKEERHIIRDIHHKFKDNKTSERICNLFFEK
jgi:hypothetical protein